MRLIRFVVWTSCCVALGIWLGSGRLGTKTPLEHLQGALRSAPRLEKVRQEVREGAEGFVEDVKKKVSFSGTREPTEKHTPSERAAIDEIIAKRQAKEPR